MCLAVTAASAQSRPRIFNKLANKKTVTRTTTQKRQTVTRTTTTGLSFGQVLDKFHGLTNVDSYGIMQQVKGYEWVFTSKSEEKQEFFPTSVTYEYYPSHPDLRRKGAYLFDKDGKLKAVILLTDAYNDNLDDTERLSKIKENLVTVLILRAYRDGAYEVDRATTGQRIAIEYELGLRNSPEGASYDDRDKAEYYYRRLKKDAEAKIESVSKITRIDATTFKVQYADENGNATVPVTIRFYPDKAPYETIYTYDFPPRADEMEGAVLKVKEEITDPSYNSSSDDIFNVVEQQPSFPGGQGALFQFLGQSLRYPLEAYKNRIQGKVLVQFVVRKDGSISNVKVVGNADPSLDKEAVRVVNSMPKWTPGTQNGEAVNVRYTLPIVFRLN